MVSKAELKQFLPTAKASLIDAVVDNWAEAEKEGITTPRRIRQFLCNIAVETGGLRSIVENMNYTSASRIQAVWPSRFKTLSAAKPYVKQPKKLAIKVYGGRLGNASSPSTDGYVFRGGGMMQTTGRDGYRKMGFEQNPGTLQTNAKVAFLTAVREWGKRGCNALADKDDTTGVRKAINGGTNGLSDVKTYLTKAKKVWPDGSSTKAPAKGSTSITNPVLVKQYQQILKDLGYTEVGFVDGSIGKQTRAAILAYRDDHGLPLEPVFDDEMVESLKTAQPRQLERNDAPASKVIAQVPEVKANWLSKIVSAITAFFSGIVALITGAFDQLGLARTYIDPLKEYAADVPGWVWLLMVAAVATGIFVISRHGEKKGVEAFQTGERR